MPAVVVADISFWGAFFLLLIFIPLVLIWGFAIVDIFRRDDIKGGWKALWLVVVIVIPFIGTLIYLLARPVGATHDERVALDELDREYDRRRPPSNPADQLKTLSELHDAGKLSDEEFAAAKAKLIAD